MAKNVIKGKTPKSVNKATKPEIKPVEVETPEEKKLSVRNTIELKSYEIVRAAEKLIPKLKEIEAFALKSSRPHRHYFIFQNDLQSFINRFKRMLR